MSVDVPAPAVRIYPDPEDPWLYTTTPVKEEWGVLYPTGKVVSSEDATRADVEPHATFPRRLVRRYVTEWETP